MPLCSLFVYKQQLWKLRKSFAHARFERTCIAKFFLSGVPFKIRFLWSHLVKNRPKACWNLFFNYQAVVSWNYFVTEPAKGIFSALISSNMFLPNDTSQLKILHGYAEGKCCQYSSQRSLCYEAKKQISSESLVVMLFKFLIVLDAGPWQVSLIRLILFYSRNVNRAARECVTNKWFCRTVFFFFLCIYRRTIELK